MDTVYHDDRQLSTKVCVRCQQEKALTAFVRRGEGYRPWCKPCYGKIIKERKARDTTLPKPPKTTKVCTVCTQEKPLEDFYLSKGKYPSSGCIECSSKRSAKWRSENSEYIHEKWRKDRYDRYHAEGEEGEAYRQVIRDGRDKWFKKNPLKRKENTRRYQARKRDATIEPVDYEAIMLRDEMLCYICTQPITPAQSYDFDHVIPLSRDGEHSMENISVTHSICNTRKNNLLLDEMPKHLRRGP